jgi:hypothetical protein
VFLIVILSNKIDLNQETRFTIQTLTPKLVKVDYLTIFLACLIISRAKPLNALGCSE